MRRNSAMAALAVLGALAGATRAQERAPAVPAHPKEIQYRELSFEPPTAADHRVVLSNGLRVYLVPDRSLPTLHAEMWLDAGEVGLPKEKRGLAKLTA